MDFAARLASLNQSANNAARRRERSSSGNGDNRRQRPRYGDNPRHSNNNQRHQTHNSDPLTPLRRMGYNVDPPSRRELSQVDSPSARKPHICLLAISIEDLTYENIWKAWAISGEAHVSLVCHAKYPDQVQSPWLQQRLLLEPPRIGRGNQWADPVPRTHTPAWGSVQILRAMLDILHDGLLIGTKKDADNRDQKDGEGKLKGEAEGVKSSTVKSANEPKPAEEDPRFDPNRYYITKNDDDLPPRNIPPVDKFIYISETCIPVQSLSACCEAMGTPTDSKSWVNARNQQMPGTPRNKYELDQFSRIRVVPSVFRWKADQWMMLSRSHAIAVRKLDNHLPEGERLWNRGFSSISASDEMYFPTVLSILHVLPKPDNSGSKDDESNDAKVKTDELCNEDKMEADNKSESKKSGVEGSLTSKKDEKPPSEVLLRAVTYTDWSEGMKNPKSHTIEDVARVTKLAKKQGSIFARKFTGPIDVEIWKNETDIE